MPLKITSAVYSVVIPRNEKEEQNTHKRKCFALLKWMFSYVGSSLHVDRYILNLILQRVLVT